MLASCGGEIYLLPEKSELVPWMEPCHHDTTEALRMSEQSKTSRRGFLTASIAATTGLVAQQGLPRRVHAAGNEVLKVALVGCGGRGTGAASQILQAHPSVRLWAMADLFTDRQGRSRHQSD